MTSNPLPITANDIMGALIGFRDEVRSRFDHNDELFIGIHDQLERHEDLLETIAQDVSLVHDQLDEHEKRFTSIDGRFTNIDGSLQEIKDTLRHHDDLIETVAREVNTLVTSLEPVLPAQHDHEERIGRLERGFTRLILKS